MPTTEPIESRTRRLFLRQWRESDRAPFAALNADPEVMEFFPAILTRAESDAMVDRCRVHFAKHGWGCWAIEIAVTGEFAGFVGLSVPRHTFDFSPCVEVGWRLARAHWGNGFASEAAAEAMHVGFERLNLTEIVSMTALGNVRSRAVMERIGMQDAGENFEHPGVPEGHRLRPHCLYRLSGERWAAAPDNRRA